MASNKSIRFSLLENKMVTRYRAPFTARVSVRGGFDSPADEYTPGRNEVKVNLSPALSLAREVETKATVEKIRTRKAVPQLDTVYDYATVTSNQVLTAGNAAEITGGDLDCDAEDPRQGLFFIPSGSTDGVRACSEILEYVPQSVSCSTENSAQTG